MSDEPLRLLDRLVLLKDRPVIGHFAVILLRVLFGTTIWRGTPFGEGSRIMHGNSTGLHPKSVVGRWCTIYQNVTLGRLEIYEDEPDDFAGIVLEDHVVVCPGAIIAAPNEGLVVGEGTVVGANSVLTRSTGSWEVWGGIPARKLGERRNKDEVLAKHAARR